MNSSINLLAAIDSVVLTHLAIFAGAVFLVLAPVVGVAYFADKNNKERKRRYEARVQADDTFHRLLRELNQREAEIRAQKIAVVVKQTVPLKKTVIVNTARRKFLPLNPQQGCIS